MLRAYKGDCLEIIPTLEKQSVDLILCDLPYNSTQADWDQLIPFDKLWPAYKEVLKSNGMVVLTGIQPFVSLMVMSNLKWFRYEMIWEKSKATGWLNSKKRPMRAHENIEVFSPKAPRYFPQMRAGEPYNKGLVKEQSERDIYGEYDRVVVQSEDGLRYPRTVHYTKTAETERGRFPLIHKTQKPISLLSYLIETFSLPGELILDNTAGSFSTGVAAVLTERDFIGIEYDPVFFTKGTEWLCCEAVNMGREVEIYL